MPYLVINGEVRNGTKRYRCGDFVPGEKGSLADMEEVGAVKWVDPKPREPRKSSRAKAVKP